MRGFAIGRHRPARHLDPATRTATPSAAPPTPAVSLEVQFPIWGLPRELGLKGAIFADAGTLFGYKGKKFFDVNGDQLISTASHRRPAASSPPP